MDLSATKKRIRASKHLCVLAGAGLSAESGIPTFRGTGGLWRTYKPEELATPAAFASDPKRVWEWYDWRRGLIANTAPNEGHAALSRLEQQSPDFWLITQNVDGLSRRAGNKKILEIHGNIWRMRCTGCRKYFKDATTPLPSLPPKCKDCSLPLRPDIVWFGEGLPRGTFDKAVTASTDSDVFILVGTMGAVEPAASLARLAQASGAYIIEINPEPTALSDIAHISLRGKAGAILPQLVH